MEALFAYVLPEYVTTLDAEAITAPAPTHGKNYLVIVTPNSDRLISQLSQAGITVSRA